MTYVDRRVAYDVGPCFVYALVDPRNNWQPFYIGVSVHPWCRFQGHHHDRSSAAWERIQEIIEDGLECELELIEEFTTRTEALSLEYRLISSLPDLVNVERRRFLHYPSALRQTLERQWAGRGVVSPRRKARWNVT